jgi:hypothetical protein
MVDLFIIIIIISSSSSSSVEVTNKRGCTSTLLRLHGTRLIKHQNNILICILTHT